MAKTWNGRITQRQTIKQPSTSNNKSATTVHCTSENSQHKKIKKKQRILIKRIQFPFHNSNYLKKNCYDIAKILLKVALNTITLTPNQKSTTLAINASILLLTLFHIRVNKTACVIYNNKTTTSKNNTLTLKTAIAHNTTRISLFDNQNKVNYKLPFLLSVLNATFNNISVISWRSVLFVEETGGPGENHRPVTSPRQTLSHNVVHLALIEIRTHNIRVDRHWLHR